MDEKENLVGTMNADSNVGVIQKSVGTPIEGAAADSPVPDVPPALPEVETPPIVLTAEASAPQAAPPKVKKHAAKKLTKPAAKKATKPAAKSGPQKSSQSKTQARQSNCRKKAKTSGQKSG